jgi:PAS domain S-box-containing protein
MDENRTVVLEEFYAPLNGWFALRIYPSDQGLAVYFREVTESRRTDDKLREQAALLDHANDAIIVRDLEHRVVYWNRSAERLYGWTAAEAIGRSVQELIHGISNSFADAMRILLAKGEWAGEVEQPRMAAPLLSRDAGRWCAITRAGRGPSSQSTMMSPNGRSSSASSCVPSAWRASAPWRAALRTT